MNKGMTYQSAKRHLSILALTCMIFVWMSGPSMLRAQDNWENVPDIQCAYVEAELTSIFMDQHPSLNVDEEVVELLYVNCSDPTPKSRLIYAYIKAANAYLAFEGTNTGQLDASMIYYRQINRDRYYLDELAQADLQFVQLYEYRYARLAQELEPRYVETIAANPDRELGLSRGYDPGPYYADTDRYRGSSSSYSEWGTSRGESPAQVYQDEDLRFANFSDSGPEIVYSRGGYRGQSTAIDTSPAQGARTASYVDYIRSAGADADRLYDYYSQTQSR